MGLLETSSARAGATGTDRECAGARGGARVGGDRVGNE